MIHTKLLIFNLKLLIFSHFLILWEIDEGSDFVLTRQKTNYGNIIQVAVCSLKNGSIVFVVTVREIIISLSGRHSVNYHSAESIYCLFFSVY